MTDPVLVTFEHDATFDAGAEFVRLAASFLAESAGEGQPVTSPLGPDELADIFREPLPRDGQPLTAVIDRLRRDVLPHAIRLSHPMYLGHQVSAPVPVAIWTEVVTAAMNNSLALREMSPAATALETQLIRWMCELAGYGGDAGGTLTSGGTEATFTALLAARAEALPGAWEDGVGDEPPVLICGEHAHYAVTRAAGELGLGMRRVVAVPSRDWRMDVAALETTLDELLRAGRRVMAVVATAGSTATGSFDDLEAIGLLCEARGIWLHVDGAHGASALLSATHRHRLRGLGRARSIAWDPHKMMLLPLSASMVLVRRERDLAAAFAQRAPYLFHGHDAGRNWDQGVRSFQCSRRFDALKVWVALQRHGSSGIEAFHDRLCALAGTLHDLIRTRPDFESIHVPESNILCFRYVGNRSMAAPALDELNLALREHYNRSGAGWLTTTVLGGRRVLRVTVMNPRTGEQQFSALLDGLSAGAAKLLAGAA